MERRVVKFGGSNLRTPEDIARVIKAVRRYEPPVVFVVSALYGVTDKLVQAVEKVKRDEAAIERVLGALYRAHERIVDGYIEDADERKRVLAAMDERVRKLGKYLLGVHCLEDIPNCADDMLLSYGERLSSLLVVSILNHHGIPCREMLPEDIGLVTDGEYGNATIDLGVSAKNLRRALGGNERYVVPGFYGISREYRITTLGRGGSDYSAAAIAHCIGASSVDLWKDVAGFMSADPRVVRSAVPLPRLSYREAAELSYFGARIFHPLTFEPLEAKGIPIRILDIGEPSSRRPRTVIGERGVVRTDVIKSVTCTEDAAVLKLFGPGIGIKREVLPSVTGAMSEARVTVRAIVSSQTSINFILSRRDLARSARIVRNLRLAVIDEIETHDDVALVAIVGEGLLERPGIAARVLGAVARRRINIQMISAGSSRVAGYFLVRRRDRTAAVRAIHAEFFG
ncbi:MAG: aspartate kinase [Candidatus Krumholzibacteriota bacterium]|nr:aspartate kinase [Candidatus Krumholzibacteriota bacterium]